MRLSNVLNIFDFDFFKKSVTNLYFIYQANLEYYSFMVDELDITIDFHLVQLYSFGRAFPLLLR